MKAVVWYDTEHALHRGPKNTAEIPERIDVILESLPRNVQIIQYNDGTKLTNKIKMIKLIIIGMIEEVFKHKIKNYFQALWV